MRSLADNLYKGAAYLLLPFAYRKNFILLLRSIFINRPFTSELMRLTPHRLWLEAANIHTVIDVGAYIGAFAFAMHQILPQAQIYSFEPLQDIYERMANNLAQFKNSHTFRTAVGNQEGELCIWRSDFSASSSALRMDENHKRAFPGSAATKKVMVPVSRLDGFLPQMMLKKKALLKVDVQGYELEVFRGAQKTLEHMDYILTEVSFKPLYKGQPLFSEVYDFLQKFSFKYVGSLENMLSPVDGSVLQADALFVHQKG